LTNISELYDFDAQDGVIVSRRFGLRSFVLGVKEWNLLIEEAYNKIGSAAEAILFGAGKLYGGSILEKEIEIMELNSESSLNLLCREATLAGWGKISIVQETPEEYKVRAQRCVFCSESGKTQHKKLGCFFLSGVISGFGETLFHTNSIVMETKCEKEYCEFAVKLGDKESQNNSS